MLNYAIDWATKKDFAITKDGKKVKFLPATMEGFSKLLDSLNGDKCRFYFEEGGGDTFKLLAKRNDYQVFTIPGKFVHDKREELEIDKSDENDVKVIYKLAELKPELFREFSELDVVTARICVLFKIRKDTEENLVRAKNRLFALDKRLELLELGKSKDKLLEKEKDTIDKLEEQFSLQTKTLEKLVKEHPLWNNYLKDEIGVGAVVAGGLIAGIKRCSKFDDKYSLRHYAGMITKKGNQTFNHQLKRTLYFFCEGIIKKRQSKWRDIYDSRKLDYQEKHPDWQKGRIHNYTMKFVETKFLDGLYKKMVEVENATAGL